MTEATLTLMKERLQDSVRTPTYGAIQQLRDFYYGSEDNKQFVKELLPEYEKSKNAENFFGLALIQYLQLEWGALETLIKELPQNEASVFLKAESLWNQERFKEALETLAHHLKKHPHTDLEWLHLLYLAEQDMTLFPKALAPHQKLINALEKIVNKDDEKEDDLRKQQLLKRIEEEKMRPSDASYLLYFLGRLADTEGYYSTASLYYKTSNELNPKNPYPLFRLAYNTSLRGEDYRAISYYEQCVRIAPAHIHALINLGILYEDAWRFDEALDCFNSVLKQYPNHKRAKLYMNDALSSKNMCFDEDIERRNDRSLQILKTPVTDFELSVRARNCLEKMNIISLGDLVKKTEAELLSYKNFGETSLMEIKEMLTKLGLKLGQTEPLMMESPKKKSLKKLQTVEDDALLSKAIVDIDFSVRARKAMSRLKINTLRDLVSKSEQDLMSIKNFGQTSLTNVKQKLAQFGLKLADSPS